MTNAPLSYGMIGGGQGAFIGAVHRTAASLDGHWRLAAGALSSTPDKSIASARDLNLPADRTYTTWRDMLAKESARPAAERLHAVSIVTPNATHFEIALGFVTAGFNVICDKPMVVSSAQAAQLAAAVKQSNTLFAVTYNYTGYPMVKQAAAMVRANELGPIRKVFVEYHQGWLATNLESTGQKQAAWRQNPALAGGAGAIGDIGTHCENLLSTVTGLEIESLAADLASLVPGRALDDDATVLIKLSGAHAAPHARALITITQIAVGEQNNLTLRIHGQRGSLLWQQEHPNSLTWHKDDGSTHILSRAGTGLHDSAARSSRLPTGHPEGFLEAFANVYAAIAAAIRANNAGHPPTGIALEYPTLADGARGTRFIERTLESARQGSRWLAI